MTQQLRSSQSSSSDERLDHQHIEYRLRERERFLRTLISNLPGIVYRCGTDDRWTTEFISNGVELGQLAGYSDTDFLETRRVTWDDIMHPDDRAAVRAEVRRLATTRVPFSTIAHCLSYRIVTATRQIKYVRDHFRFVDDESGRAIALEGVITDVTDLTLADARVRDAEGRYRLLAENMNDLVCLHDVDGSFLFLSPSCERVLGFTAAELVGTSPFLLVHPDDVAALRDGVVDRLRHGEPAMTSEHRMRRRSGQYVWLETLWQRIGANQGEPVQVLTSSRDISRRKIAESERLVIEEKRAASLVSEQLARHEAEQARETVEAALAEAEVSRIEGIQANRAKDEFLQMVSHEFRTPLTTIKMAARVLLNSSETEQERRQHLETIVTECDRQIDMVVNLLDVSRLEEGSVDLRHEPVSLAQVLQACERVARDAARMRDQTFRVDTRDGVPAARGDGKALRRVFCTIIENAIKYTPEGGRIDVCAEAVASGEVVVHVSDNGRGVRTADLPYIFEKFYRGQRTADPSTDGTPDDAAGAAETPGVGLGLYLAQRLIHALDGRIEVTTREGQGSRFSVYLPRWDETRHYLDDAGEYGFEEPDKCHD